MAIMECWWRDKYEITSAKFLFLYQYLSPWLPRTKNRFLALCGLMSESRLTARQHIEGIDLGLPLALFILNIYTPLFPLCKGCYIIPCICHARFGGQLKMW